MNKNPSAELHKKLFSAAVTSLNQQQFFQIWI